MKSRSARIVASVAVAGALAAAAIRVRARIRRGTSTQKFERQWRRRSKPPGSSSRGPWFECVCSRRKSARRIPATRFPDISPIPRALRHAAGGTPSLRRSSTISTLSEARFIRHGPSRRVKGSFCSIRFSVQLGRADCRRSEKTRARPHDDQVPDRHARAWRSHGGTQMFQEEFGAKVVMGGPIGTRSRNIRTDSRRWPPSAGSSPPTG